MELSSIGKIVDKCINEIPLHTPSAEIWNYVVMPNHIHMVISISPVKSVQNSAAPNIGCLKPPMHDAPCNNNHFNSGLAVVVRTFKAAVTRLAASFIQPTFRQKQAIWQRNYHEHIIRNQRAFDNIMNYIDTNVEKWGYDRFNGNGIQPEGVGQN